MTREQIQIYMDPDLLQLVGQIAEVIGLAEHVERIFNTRRRRISARHQAINRSWLKPQRSLVTGRGAIRQIRSTLAAQLTDAPADTVAIAMAYDDFTVFKKGLEQLHQAIGEMFDATYELEAETEPIIRCDHTILPYQRGRSTCSKFVEQSSMRSSREVTRPACHGSQAFCTLRAAEPREGNGC